MAKLSFFLIALFVIISTVDLSSNPKKQVMASRDLALDLAAMEQNLLGKRSGLGTCLRYCTSNSDCNDCWLCCDCVPSAFGDVSQCDKLTVNGEGYFGTILKNQQLIKNKIKSIA